MKKCPHCAKASKSKLNVTEGNWQVECPKCGSSSGKWSTEAAAIRAWDRRESEREKDIT